MTVLANNQNRYHFAQVNKNIYIEGNLMRHKINLSKTAMAIMMAATIGTGSMATAQATTEPDA